uniref:Putative secreted protein n=1 Tax=Ixodes ricinus TaxID=34613 RepID=A0A6B0TX96_IXORI
MAWVTSSCPLASGAARAASSTTPGTWRSTPRARSWSRTRATTVSSCSARTARSSTSTALTGRSGSSSTPHEAWPSSGTATWW